MIFFSQIVKRGVCGKLIQEMKLTEEVNKKREQVKNVTLFRIVTNLLDDF